MREHHKALTGQLLEKSEFFVKELDLNGLIKEVVEMKRIAFGNDKVKINFFPSGEVYKVVANETKLKFVLSNIINNAREAIPNGLEGRIDVELTFSDAQYILTIVDNGHGIRRDDIGKVFERGVSVGKPGGCGFGLSDAKENIEKLNGTIGLTSVCGKSTTITICLPAINNTFLFHGSAPFAYVFVEDYKLTQLLWLEAAKDHNFNFAVFSSPSDFERHSALVSKDAHIYVDSHFPDFGERGEKWSQKVYEMGYQNIWLCSTEKIEIADKPWIRGAVSKENPFCYLDGPVKVKSNISV